MATLFRAAIMLTVLVGLPAAWIYYGPLPPRAQRVVDQCLTAAKGAVDWERLDWDQLSQLKWPWREGSAAPQAAPQSVPQAAPLQLTEAPRFDAGVAPAAAEAAAPAPAPHGATPLHDELEPLLGQLRQWNVVEYSLVRWGASGELFRFACAMPLGAAGPALTQQFEAVAPTPQAAVEQVYRDVVAWQAARPASDADGRLASY